MKRKGRKKKTCLDFNARTMRNAEVNKKKENKKEEKEKKREVKKVYSDSRITGAL